MYQLRRGSAQGLSEPKGGYWEIGKEDIGFRATDRTLTKEAAQSPAALTYDGILYTE
nr:hypothetical protein [Cloacibacillus evryensis]